MNDEPDSFWTLISYFECCRVPVAAHGIDMIDTGKIENKSYF